VTRCDLCCEGSELEPVLVIEATPAPAFERRKPGPRHQHQSCADNLAAHRAAENARTYRWLDEQYEQFAARRMAVAS
jgi:hypothetical protein